MRHFAWLALSAGLLPAQSEADLRQTVTRALPILERSAASFAGKRACVSCHHNFLPVLMFHMARERGFAFDSAMLKAVEDRTFHGLRSESALDDAIQAVTLNDPTPNDSFLLMSAHAAGLPPDLTLGVYARRLAAWQRDGHWVSSDFRPPHSSSSFTATASAVRAIRFYMPAELSAERDACIERARRWLAKSTPKSTEDAAFRLLGLVWAGASGPELDAAKRDVLALQQPGGGWRQLAGYDPDAYSTGEALFTLREAGMDSQAAPWRNGAKFLMSAQAADGSWRVHTRMLSPASVSPKYFSTGFPYEKDEYLSYAGSCWAVMALVNALPRSAPAPEPLGGAPAEPTWIRTALFGTSEQLAGLLDQGMDANRKTERGTTLLMMVAPEAGKVRLLLSRGADPSTDAVTIAAAYRGTAQSIRALLDAGAAVEPPQGKRAPRLPLVFASMSGDLENVKLLLERGADPARAAGGNAPLPQAVTFGYPGVVRALIDAGAPAKITESSGINLLHWAAIAHRPEVIPALVKAGAAVNATDENGYTPLMYAATLDFGDSDSIRALRAAGASLKIPNGEGRTPIQQARFYRHPALEAALR